MSYRDRPFRYCADPAECPIEAILVSVSREGPMGHHLGQISVNSEPLGEPLLLDAALIEAECLRVPYGKQFVAVCLSGGAQWEPELGKMYN